MQERRTFLKTLYASDEIPSSAERFYLTCSSGAQSSYGNVLYIPFVSFYASGTRIDILGESAQTSYGILRCSTSSPYRFGSLTGLNSFNYPYNINEKGPAITNMYQQSGKFFLFPMIIDYSSSTAKACAPMDFSGYYAKLKFNGRVMVKATSNSSINGSIYVDNE